MPFRHDGRARCSSRKSISLELGHGEKRMYVARTTVSGGGRAAKRCRSAFDRRAHSGSLILMSWIIGPVTRIVAIIGTAEPTMVMGTHQLDVSGSKKSDGAKNVVPKMKTPMVRTR